MGKKHLTRRSALKAIGASGLAWGGVSIGGATKDFVEITVVRDHEGPKRTKWVPRDAYDYNQRAKDAYSKLAGIAEQNEHIVSVSMVGSGESIDNYGVLQPKAGIAKDGDPTNVPDSIDGIPVKKDIGEERQLLSCENMTEFDPIRGGIIMEDEDNTGTLCHQVFDMDASTSHFLACAHVMGYEDICGYGDEMSLTQAGQDIGDIDNGGTVGDWAIVDLPPDADIEVEEGVQWTADDTRHIYDGWWTKSGLEDECANNSSRRYSKQGYRTGDTGGHIQGIKYKWTGETSDGQDCYTTTDSNGDGFGLVIGASAGHGDSGGPMFTESEDDPDRLVAAGHTVAGENYGYTGEKCGSTDEETIYEDTIGTPSYWLNKQYGLQPLLGD